MFFYFLVNYIFIKPRMAYMPIFFEENMIIFTLFTSNIVNFRKGYTYIRPFFTAYKCCEFNIVGSLQNQLNLL